MIAAGQTTGTVTLTAVQETLVVGNETIVVDISQGWLIDRVRKNLRFDGISFIRGIAMPSVGALAEFCFPRMAWQYHG